MTTIGEKAIADLKSAYEAGAIAWEDAVRQLRTCPPEEEEKWKERKRAWEEANLAMGAALHQFKCAYKVSQG